MNLYVGNLSFETTESQLKEAFEAYGQVSSAAVITDRETGRSRGFGFIEMGDAEGRAAMEGLNEKELNGRQLGVNEAKPRESHGGGGGQRGGQRGGY